MQQQAMNTATSPSLPTAYKWLQAARRKLPVGRRSTGDLYFLAFTSCAVIFLAPMALALQAFGFETASRLSLATIAGVSLSMLLWRLGKRLLPAMLLFQLTLLATILLNAVLTGGVVSPALIWLGIVPLLMLFVVSRAWCNAFLMLCLGSVLALFALQSLGWLEISAAATQSELQFATLMHCFFIVTQMILVSTIEGVNLQQIKRIERNNERLNQLAVALEKAMNTRTSSCLRSAMRCAHPSTGSTATSPCCTSATTCLPKPANKLATPIRRPHTC